jgi:hypothetical protein
MHRQTVASEKNLFISMISICLSVANLQKILDISYIIPVILKWVFLIDNNALIANQKAPYCY